MSRVHIGRAEVTFFDTHGRGEPRTDGEKKAASESKSGVSDGQRLRYHEKRRGGGNGSQRTVGSSGARC